MDEYNLSDLEKDYYLGNFQSCINKANSMRASRESTYYLCLSYLTLKKYDILELELKKSSEFCIKLVGILYDYVQNVDERSAIIGKLKEMLVDKSIDSKDDLSRLVVSSIFVREKQYSEALGVIHLLDTLPAIFAQISILLLMNRIDIAERHLKLMQNKDDYATLTLLAVIQVKLASGGSKEAYDIASELEDKYRPTPMLKNIQTAAAINLGEYDTAKDHCKTALDMDNDNLEALINMIFIQSKLKDSVDIRNRNLDRLRTLYPHHDYIKEIERLEVELN